jgi:protein-S-isoprenylcysteine O-methyltransferase Ste14
VSGLLFCGFSSIGLTSAYFMVRYGEGTPIPVDQTNRLVLSGPYRYVRNPMAIAGLGQGLAVALLFLSLPLVVYCLLGGMVWHWVVRPFEERDMIERFGEPYRDYQKRVSCWIPRLGKG